MAYQQSDWTSVTGHCLFCGGAIRSAGTGRPGLYCSYGHKQKAYRQRLKALRNAHTSPKTVTKPTAQGAGEQP